MFCTKYFAKYIFLQNEKNVNVFFCFDFDVNIFGAIIGRLLFI